MEIFFHKVFFVAVFMNDVGFTEVVNFKDRSTESPLRRKVLLEGRFNKRTRSATGDERVDMRKH